MSRYEINFLEQYTDDDLIAELRRVASLLPEGKHLTKTAYDVLGPRVAHTTIRRRFGGWKSALEKAGLGHLYIGQPVSQKMRDQPIKNLSNDELIDELRRVYVLCGKDWLTSDDFNIHSPITSEDAVRLRFGSFRKGLEAAGIPHAPHKQRLRTDEKCFENIASVWTHYGRRPMYREMFLAPSTIQAKTYVLRWGTWRKAVKAFIDWANSEGKEEVTLEVGDTTNRVTIPQAVNTEADCREVRPGLRFKVFHRDRFRCVICGRSPATHLNVELHADHIKSVAAGGKTIFENLQTLCQDCNLGKGRHSIVTT